MVVSRAYLLEWAVAASGGVDNWSGSPWRAPVVASAGSRASLCVCHVQQRPRAPWFGLWILRAWAVENVKKRTE